MAKSKTTPKKKTETALEVKKVSKSFKLPTEQASGIKQAFINFTKGVKGYKKQEVLKDISFKVEKGDFFGIVGRNGSGKSTLLKLISQIYEPDSGGIKVNGTLVPFIELGVGFNPDLTGRENVYLNGALLGFSHEEVSSMYEEIVEFAELEEFMDQKLKNYSSGMQVRLAFSIAIKAQGDILVLDEVLAVGDEAFQRKCSEFFADIKKDKSKTVILVTHSMASVRQYCNKAMMIRDGNIIITGNPEDVANEYNIENMTTNQNNLTNEKSNRTEVKDLEVELLSDKQISQDEKVRVKVKYETLSNIQSYIAITLYDIDRNIPIINSNSSDKKFSGKGKFSTESSYDVSAINDSKIKVLISVKNKDGDILAYYSDQKSPTFILRRTDYPNMKKRTTNSILMTRGEWTRRDEK